MVPFAGWEMPVQYPTGPIEEHHITRRSAGLFDIDHMGQFTVSGPDAEPYLNHVATWDVSRMAENEAHYSLMCYEDGGIVDDIFLYRLPGRWLVVVNAANRAKDLAWMQKQAAGYDVTISDVSDNTYMIALQGPNALPLLQRFTDVDLAALPRFAAAEDIINNVEMIIGRTGYTGEDGVELFFPAEHALAIWQAILDAGTENEIEVAPIGLAARDSLRFEPGFALYGHEIDADTTPLEANLRWVCKFETDFIGKEALLAQREQGPRKKLVAFEMTERSVPREGYTIADADGNEIGTVVTGMFAPTVEKYCGHAFVHPDHAAVGTPIQILIRNRPRGAKIVKRPFYKPSYRA
jgi:glycine cleavage system T protein